jgi:holo-[acyl-carrier protein] synthase
MIRGTGIDIVEISRFERFVREGNSALLERLFTEAERAVCAGRKKSAECYATRFAAKEAFLKALGTGLRDGVSWREMEVVNDGLGKPELRLSGKAESLFRELGLSNCFLSLSHDGGVAAAMVVLEGI